MDKCMEMPSPPKVRIFAWKLGRVPTKKNKFKRNLEPSPTCGLCGKEEETSYHAVMSCRQARTLRDAMRDHWDLPDEAQCRYTGGEWLLLLIDRATDDQRNALLLLLWQAWYVHNNIVHDAGLVSVKESVGFLLTPQLLGEPVHSGQPTLWR